MELYNNIREILLKRLKRSLENDTLSDYLFGLNSSFLKENPRDQSSQHAFYETMLVYHNYCFKHPEARLEEKYYLELNKQLDEGDFFDIYSVFENIRMQIKIENESKSAFKLERDKLINILKKLTYILEKNKNYLENYKYMKGEEYSNGVYGYIQEEIKNFKSL